MVYSVVKNFQKALKYRGGWKGLLEHMYTVSLHAVDMEYTLLLYSRPFYFCILCIISYSNFLL